MPKIIQPSDHRVVPDMPLGHSGTIEQGHPPLTSKQRTKRDALELAELIYDIFQDSLSNDKITDMKEEKTPDA